MTADRSGSAPLGAHDTRDIDASCPCALAVGCTFQNEARYLKEWIEFHKMVGVQRFVLVNDRSTDDFATVLAPYVAAGEVELFDLPCPEPLQTTKWIQYQGAVLDALVRHMCGISRWLALIDIDEFLVPIGADTILDVLRDQERAGGVYVRWEPFGTSGVAALADDDLLIEKLCWKDARIDRLGKSIVKPHWVRRANIHRCELLDGYAYIDIGSRGEGHRASLRLHHYWTRDEAFLVDVKLPRAARIKGWDVGPEKLDYFLGLFNDVPDDTMARFLPELRTRVYGVATSTAPPLPDPLGVAEIARTASASTITRSAPRPRNNGLRETRGRRPGKAACDPTLRR